MSAEGPPTLRFRATADDMAAAADLIWRGFYRRLAIMVGVLAAIGIVVGLAAGDAIATIATGVILASAAIVLLLSGSVRRAVSRRLMGRRYRSLAGQDDFVVALTGRGIRSQHAESTTLIRWAEVTGVLEDERTIVLMVGPSRRLLLPKRAFPSVHAAAAFRAALERGVGNSRHP